MKMKKVLLYALGEILLVVVGILIAVNINNWNNNRKLAQVETVALSRLTEDIKSDLKRYEFLEKRLSERIARCDSTLLLLEKQNSLTDRLGLISIHLVNFFLIESNTTTYDEMLNTGRLYALNKPELRKSIIRYYQNVNKWSKYIEKDNSQIRAMVIQPQLNDYWTVQKRIWAEKEINTTEFPWLTRQYSRELKDLEALLLKVRANFDSHRNTSSFLKWECENLLTILEEGT